MQSKVLAKIDLNLLNPNNTLNHIDTLLLIGDMQTIDEKLKDLYEYKFISTLENKIKFLKLLQNDQSNFIQVLSSLYNTSA